MSDSRVSVENLPPLWRVSDAALLRELQAVREAQHRLSAQYHRLLAEMDTRRLSTDLGYGSTTALVQDLTQDTRAMVRKDLDRALALYPSRNFDGSDHPPVAPLTGQAALDGALSPGKVDALVTVMTKLPPGLTVEECAGVEKILLDLATTAGIPEIRKAGERVLATVDPDGAEPKGAVPPPGPELWFREHRDGTASFGGQMPLSLYAVFRSVIDDLAKPEPAVSGERDPRSLTERQGDAFADVLHLIQAAPELPSHQGERVHVTLTVGLDQLRSGLGTACLDGIGDITATEARLLACDAGILPMVMGGDTQPLDLGRRARTATHPQRTALAIRDRGCTFPGCPRRPRYCQAHHVQHWADGGSTDLANLALLCSRHHRLIHHSGWEIRMATDGKPDYLPPDFLDPLRRPRRNAYHGP